MQEKIFCLWLLLLSLGLFFIRCVSFKYTKKLKNNVDFTISFDGGKFMDLKEFFVTYGLAEITGVFGVCFRQFYKRTVILK